MHRQRSIILLLATAELAVVSLVLYPQWSGARALKKQIGYAEQQMNAVVNRSAPPVSVRASDALAKLVADLESQFIDQTKGVDFLDRLDALADDEQVNLELRFGKDPTPSTPQVIPLSMTVEGSLLTVLRFMNSVEHLPNAVAIRSVSLLPIEDQKVRANVDVDTLWR